MFLYAIVASAIVYYLIQQWDDRRSLKEGKELATTGKRCLLFFFILMVVMVGGHLGYNALYDTDGKLLIGGSGPATDKDVLGTTLPNNDIWRRIPEEVHVGMPPF